MVSHRCKLMVEHELSKLGLHPVTIDLGIVELMEDINDEQWHQLNLNLIQSGLQLQVDKRSILTEKIKNIIIKMIHSPEGLPVTKYSFHISDQLNHPYTYLANVFSEQNGVSIRQFIINHKIERVKELIQLGELNLTEISDKLHYSSVSHLSNQFRKTTGISPSLFKQHNNIRSCNLEDV